MSSVLYVSEMCWGDVGLLLSMPRQGLGNAAIAAVANDEQNGALRQGQVGGDGDHRAVVRLGLGGDPTTAVLDGDEYVLNGEKIYVTAGIAGQPHRGLGDAGQVEGPRGDQVVRRRRANIPA